MEISNDFPEIHEKFPIWYETNSATKDSDLIQLRAEAMQTFLQDISRQDINSLIRILFRKKPSVESLERLKFAFKATDEAYSIDDERELHILSATILCSLLLQNSKTSAYCALALCSSYMSGNRITVDLPMHLEALSAQALERMSFEQRERSPFKNKKGEFRSIGIPKELSDRFVAEGVTKETIEASLTTMSRLIVLRVQSISEELLNRIEALEYLSSLQDEELEMLWWTIGGHSRNYDSCCKFEDLPANGRALILSADLAAATKTIPGPASITALLSHAGVQGQDTVSIPDVVNDCKIEWLDTLSLDSPNDLTDEALLTPIHFAIRRKLETREEIEWIAPWTKLTELKKGLKPLTMARLFYLERLQILYAEF